MIYIHAFTKDKMKPLGIAIEKKYASYIFNIITTTHSISVKDLLPLLRILMKANVTSVIPVSIFSYIKNFFLI